MAELGFEPGRMYTAFAESSESHCPSSRLPTPARQVPSYAGAPSQLTSVGICLLNKGLIMLRSLRLSNKYLKLTSCPKLTPDSQSPKHMLLCISKTITSSLPTCSGQKPGGILDMSLFHLEANQSSHLNSIWIQKPISTYLHC